MKTTNKEIIRLLDAGYSIKEMHDMYASAAAVETHPLKRLRLSNVAISLRPGIR